MEKHPVEKIKFFMEPSKHWGDYGMSRINGQSYRHGFSINGERFTNDGLEFGTFRSMLEKPGDYFPFCCSYCGVSGCDGIFVPIRCLHSGDEIILIIREPMWDVCNSCEYNDECENQDGNEALMCPNYHVRYRAHRVKKEQMREALDELERSTPPA